MLHEFSRTQLLLGEKALEYLKQSSVAIFGIGGVGSYAAEALARCSVGRIALFDDDSVCITNINRQLVATHKTVGQKKVHVMADRILDINPRCSVIANEIFYSDKNDDEFDLSQYDYILDAIDTVSSKLLLIENSQAANVSIISCMGAGNKLDPTQFEVDDIYKTSVCPLAKVMRRELRNRGIQSLKVVYSKETVVELQKSDQSISPYTYPPDGESKGTARRQVPGSISFVPSVAGLIMASEVVKDLLALQPASKLTDR